MDYIKYITEFCELAKLNFELETIFVDEGFGSLDSEALDLAMKALIDLQENGRLVGIISHIGDLRERINAALEVTIGKDGSTASFVVG